MTACQESKIEKNHSVLKMIEKVSFNIASEASYIYILSGQKRSILASFWKPEACSQILLPNRLPLIGRKLLENAKIQKAKFWVIFKHFETMFPLGVALPPSFHPGKINLPFHY